MIQLLFTRKRTVSSFVIRAFCGSLWSHVALVDGEHVIEAVGLHGVRRVPWAEALRGTSHHTLVDFIEADPVPVLRAAKAQVGKPYDFKAIFGLWLRSGWDETDAWFCSELVAWALEQGGHRLFRTKDIPRVTQQHLWMLAPAGHQMKSQPADQDNAATRQRFPAGG